MSRSTIGVMFVVPCLSVGGAERHVVTLVPEMDPTKFTPSVICIGDEGELFPDLERAGVDATALHLDGTRNIGKALRMLVLHMRRLQPDVVVVRGYNAEMLGRLAAVIAGVRSRIVWVHNAYDIKPRGMVRKVADRLLSPLTSAYFGVAHAQRPYMVNDLGYPDHKVRIIHNGVNPALFECHDDRSLLAEFGIGPGDPVVGIVAGLRAEKDHITFLRAARLVLDEIPTARFLVIGDGLLRVKLEALSAELGIQSNVHFTGNRSDVGSLLRAMDVFTLSSGTVECFPFALLEAMASARPAVCTNVGGVGEIVEHGVTGYLVPPRDPQQLAARLVEMVSNLSAARQMGGLGRRRVESKFSLERSVKEAEIAIADVVEGPIRSNVLSSTAESGI
jgi:glycosyltransferase involved in cell wall biosynthesis